MSRFSKTMAAMLASGALAIPLATQFLLEREGTRYEAYQDGGGVWTICNGHTAGVKPGDTATPDECRAMLQTEVEQAATVVNALVRVPMSEPQRAALISFCAYNIGPGKCAKSTFLRRLNKGDKAAACDEIKRWIFDGGKDCRIPASNCFGQVERRDLESQLCSL